MRGIVGDVPSALRWAAEVGTWAPMPGEGETNVLWRLLANVAAADVGLARVLEPHLDALAILRQAGVSPARVGADAQSTWGVFAAEAPGNRVLARRDAGEWRVDGVKPWCSLAQHLTHALVTARLDDGGRRLFAVDLRATGVTAHPGPWVARGLNWIVSAPVNFEGVRAVPIGEPEWYLQRPGFHWGGIGVAACWFGGATGVARALLAALSRGLPDQLALAHIGAVDVALHSARTALAAAASSVDDPDAADDEHQVLSLRTRAIVANAAETVLQRVGHALGPMPLVSDEDHARRVADLELYIRQHHAERDDVALGTLLLERGETPW